MKRRLTNEKKFCKALFNVCFIYWIIIYIYFRINLYLGFLNDYLKGFTLSFGITVTLFSLIVLASPKYIEKMKVNESDERVIMIKEKQMSAGYYFHIAFSTVLVIMFGFFEDTYILSVGIAAMLLVEGLFLFFMGFIYKRKY